MSKFAIVGLALVLCGGVIVRPVEAKDRNTCEVFEHCSDAEIHAVLDGLCPEQPIAACPTPPRCPTLEAPAPTPPLPSSISCRHYSPGRTSGFHCTALVRGVVEKCRAFTTDTFGNVAPYGCKFKFPRGE